MWNIVIAICTGMPMHQSQVLNPWAGKSFWGKNSRRNFSGFMMRHCSTQSSTMTPTPLGETKTVGNLFSQSSPSRHQATRYSWVTGAMWVKSLAQETTKKTQSGTQPYQESKLIIKANAPTTWLCYLIYIRTCMHICTHTIIVNFHLHGSWRLSSSHRLLLLLQLCSHLLYALLKLLVLLHAKF